MTAIRPHVDQIWRDNDPRIIRFIKVVRIAAARVQIVRVHESGVKWKNAHDVWTDLDRFNGTTGRNKFTFVRES